MPFSHPRQLIDMMPLLRQYAFVSTLLYSTFGPKTEPPPPDMEETSPKKEQGKEKSKTTTTRDQLADFFGDGEAAAETSNGASYETDCDAKLDVILWVHPAPHLQVVFPLDRLKADITLKIREGGTVEIVEDNVTTAGRGEALGKGKGKELTRETLGKALEYFEDLGKWVEWIRTRY